MKFNVIAKWAEKKNCLQSNMCVRSKCNKRVPNHRWNVQWNEQMKQHSTEALSHSSEWHVACPYETHNWAYTTRRGGRKKKSHSGDSLIMRRQHSGLNFDQSAFVRAWPSSSALMCPEPSLSTARNHCSTCGSTGCWWPRPAEYAMGHLSHATTNDFKEDTSQDYAISTHNLYRNVHFVVWIPGNIRKESVSKVTKHSKTIKQMNFWWINGARRASRSFLFFFVIDRRTCKKRLRVRLSSSFCIEHTNEEDNILLKLFTMLEQPNRSNGFWWGQGHERTEEKPIFTKRVDQGTRRMAAGFLSVLAGR